MKRFVSFLCVLAMSLFWFVSDCFADEVGIEFKNNLSKESISSDVKKEIKNKVDTPKASNQDIFGDEQTFPFVAGLGKNAAH